MSSKDLQVVVKTQKAFIKELLDRLESGGNKSFVNIQDSVIAQKVRECVKRGYFNNLSIEQIFDLAKMSIRLTDENCKMCHKLEDIEEIVNAIYDYQVECKDKTNKEFLDKQLQKISDKLLDK